MAGHRGRIVKRIGHSALVESASAIDAVARDDAPATGDSQAQRSVSGARPVVFRKAGVTALPSRGSIGMRQRRIRLLGAGSGFKLCDIDSLIWI